MDRKLSRSGGNHRLILLPSLLLIPLFHFLLLPLSFLLLLLHRTYVQDLYKGLGGSIVFMMVGAGAHPAPPPKFAPRNHAKEGSLARITICEFEIYQRHFYRRSFFIFGDRHAHCVYQIVSTLISHLPRWMVRSPL